MAQYGDHNRKGSTMNMAEQYELSLKQGQQEKVPSMAEQYAKMQDTGSAIPSGDLETQEHSDSLNEIMNRQKSGDYSNIKSYYDVETYGNDIPNDVYQRSLGNVIMGDGSDPSDVQKRIDNYILDSQLEGGSQALGDTSDLLLDITPAGKAIGAVAGVAAAGATANKVRKLLKRRNLKKDNVGKLSAKASSGDEMAIEELAKRTKADGNAIESSESLGIELPMDVYATGEKGIEIQKTAGLARSQVGGVEEAKFTNSIIQASSRADELTKELGATSDIASLSDDVLHRLRGTIDDLKKQEKVVYESIRHQMPSNVDMELPNIQNAVNEIKKSLRGDTSTLTSGEKRLLKILDRKSLNYEALDRERKLIGQALGKGNSPYADGDSYLLGQVYDAIKSDQLHNIDKRLPHLSGELQGVNKLTVQRKTLEDQVVKSFGKDGFGSIAGAIKSSIAQGSKGIDSNLKRVLSVVPEEMKGDVIATGISEVVRDRKGNFSFAEFEKVYKGLIDHPTVYKQVLGAIGKDKHKLLNDMYNVSKVINKAQTNIIRTGKSNQAIIESMTAEGFVSRMIRLIGEKTPKTLIGVDVKLDAVLMSPKERVENISKMFRSDSFKNLVKEMAVKNGDVLDDTIEAFLKEPVVAKATRSYAKSEGKSPNQAIREIIRPPKVQEQYRKEIINPKSDEPDFIMIDETEPALLPRQSTATNQNPSAQRRKGEMPNVVGNSSLENKKLFGNR